MQTARVADVEPGDIQPVAAGISGQHERSEEFIELQQVRKLPTADSGTENGGNSQSDRIEPSGPGAVQERIRGGFVDVASLTTEEKAQWLDVVLEAMTNRWQSGKWSWWCRWICGGKMHYSRDDAKAEFLDWCQWAVKRFGKRNS